MKTLYILFMVTILSPYALAQKKGEMPFTASNANSNAMLRKAWVHFGDAQFKQGSDIAQQIVKDDPDCAFAYLFLPSKDDAEYKSHIQTAQSKKVSEDEKIFIDALDAREAGGTQNFDPLIKKYPKDLYLQLMILYNTADETKAIALGEDLTKKNSKFPPAYNMLGYLYMTKKDMVLADASFNKYMKLRPDLANPYDSKGDFMMANQRYSDAVPLFEKAAAMGMVESTRKAENAKARIKYGDLPAAEKEQIKSMLTVSFDGYEKRNLDQVLGAYADQSIEIWDNQASNVGLANIKSRVGNMFEDITFPQEDYYFTSVDGIGPVAVVTGTETSKVKNEKTGKEESRQGNALFLMRKQKDGNWKVLVDHFYDQTPGGNDLSDADKKSINQLVWKWSQIAQEGQLITEAILDKMEVLYSKQAVEIMPWQGANVGIANIRARWTQGIVGNKISYSDLGSLGTAGLGRRAVVWGLGAQETTPKDSQEVVKAQFPWAMIVTKEKDDVWRILAIHWYAE
jgi:ketosteroid isomerase-like protein